MGEGLRGFGFPAKMNYLGAFELKTREGELDSCHCDLPLVSLLFSFPQNQGKQNRLKWRHWHHSKKNLTKQPKENSKLVSVF